MQKKSFHIAVIGAGVMGRGIAQQAVASGCRVSLTSYHAASRARAREHVLAFFAHGLQRGKLNQAQVDDDMQRLTVVDTLAEACADAEIIVESVVEDLAIKQKLLRKLDLLAPAGAVFCSNTSSLPIKKLAAVLRQPERMLGTHFFNPVHVLRLVELVTTTNTADWALQRALNWSGCMNKDAIQVKDNPGFASSRLGVVLGLEAMRMVEQGVATVRDIDKAMELGYRHPMGPLKLSDHIGLDVRLAIAESLYKSLGESQYEPPQILRQMVQSGHLGRKVGQGFYRWDVDSGVLLEERD